MSEQPSQPIFVSIAVFAWNEEAAIPTVLRSLFAQTLFAELEARGLRSEVVCVLNGCTDGTAKAARSYFESHAQPPGVRCAVCDLPEKGKLNAWNHYVHSRSAPEARYLVFLDADILIHEPRTLWNLVALLESDREAHIAVDRPVKHIQFLSRKNLTQRLSSHAADVTSAAEAQLCAQLYAMRAGVARNIHLPKDLPACEDGFIKALVSTDFLDRSVQPGRIRLAKDAEHTFEAYTGIQAIVRNQKRQALAQVVVHLLIDLHLRNWPEFKRHNLALHLRELDRQEPSWLKQLTAGHVARSPRFWHLCPGYITTPFRRWSRLPSRRRWARLPVACATSGLAALGLFLAHRALRRGCHDYWPKAARKGFGAAAAGRMSSAREIPETARSI